MSLFLRWALSGLLATLTMDVGSTLVRKTGFTAGLEPKLIGRWFASIARGVPIDRTILDVPPLPGELPFAAAGHYLIGIGLTLTLWMLLSVAALRPSAGGGAALGLGFGLITNVLPWLVMFPAMGFGFLGESGPPDLLLFRSSLVNHAIFGVGLALWPRVLGVMG
jgi:hypothetical protein